MLTRRALSRRVLPSLLKKPHLKRLLRTSTDHITGTGYTEPGNPTVLAKHIAKEEPLAGSKLKLDLENYAGLGAGDIHAGYLHHLHTSRELEAGQVNLMRERYEVWLLILLYMYPFSRQV